MAQVAVTINGRGYQIACDDGQEEHLRTLAASIDRRVGELVAAMGQVGDNRLLVMASLLVADELSEVSSELKDLKSQIADGANVSADTEKRVEALIDRMAGRIESVAGRLERP